MVRKITTGLAACFAALFALATSAESANWPTTEFIIIKADPYSVVPEILQGADNWAPEQAQAVVFMETFLTKVAKEYEKMGFRAPELEVRTGRSGGDAYTVHFFNYPDKNPDGSGTGPARVTRVSATQTQFQVDASRARFPGGKPDGHVYEHLAHELFHVAQRAYQPGNDTLPGDWVIEGQAQAVGQYMAMKLRGVDNHRGTAEDYRLGGRPYFIPLSHPEASDFHDADYRTSSFWRYVGEHYAASKRNGRAGVEVTQPDFSYLVKMFAVPYASTKSQSADLIWADKGLRAATGLSLARIYANFVSTFADFVPVRMTRAPKGTVTDAQDGWLNLLFGGCKEPMNLTATSVSGEFRTEIDRNASRCFKVQVFGEGKVDLSIHVRSADAAGLADLRIGTRGGTRVGSPVVFPSPAGGGYVGHWRFTIDGEVPEVFVVSNVSEDPRDTGKVDVKFHVATGYWDSNMTSPRERPSKPRPQSAGASNPKQPAKDETRQAAKRELDAELDSLSARAASSSSVNHGRNRRGCVKEAFAETGCGPTTSITLSLMPGSFADLFQTTGTGGGLAQLMSQFTAIADKGVFATSAGINDALQKTADTEGSLVELQFPAIDYGFQGTFSNADIKVSSGVDRQKFYAKGPNDIQRGRGRLYPTSGVVTIDEFTPFVLRGSFQAGLVDLPNIDFSMVGDDYTLPIARTISGSFAITAPWEGDDRVEPVVTAGGTHESAIQDLYEAFPAIRNFNLEEMIPPETLEELKTGEGTANTIGSLPTSEVSEFPVCACECSYDRSQPRSCLKICKPVILSCGQAKQMAERYNIAAEPQPATEPARPTRKQYIEGLIENGIPPGRIDFLVKEMDAFMAEHGGWPTE